jgi:hypothetical protein
MYDHPKTTASLLERDLGARDKKYQFEELERGEPFLVQAAIIANTDR